MQSKKTKNGKRLSFMLPPLFICSGRFESFIIRVLKVSCLIPIKIYLSLMLFGLDFQDLDRET